MCDQVNGVGSGEGEEMGWGGVRVEKGKCRRSLDWIGGKWRVGQKWVHGWEGM